MFWFLVITVFLLLLFIPSKKSKNKDIEVWLTEEVETSEMKMKSELINFKSLSDRTFQEKIKDKYDNSLSRLGNAAGLKLFFFFIVIAVVTWAINSSMFYLPILKIMPLTLVVSVFLLNSFLQQREENRFEEEFPICLGLISNAVSAGESLAKAIVYAGEQLDEAVLGKEMKKMGERLLLGEEPDEVFRKSCKRFNYASFHFFIITLRVNLNKGGQLKDVISRLNRMMFVTRTMDKKMLALTSEARISAKIVVAIPFIFLFGLRFISPDNFNFVMHEEAGQPILYYVLISEFIGISIIQWLVKGFK